MTPPATRLVAAHPLRPDGRLDPRPPEAGAGPTPRWLALAIGLAAIGFSVLYVAADVVETLQGSFSAVRLSLTYAAEAAIPLFVLGLWSVQRPRIGRLGALGAAVYAYAYVFFTSTVVFALVTPVPDYEGVTAAFGSWMVVHGAVMVVGGVMFGVAVTRAGMFPRWTGIALAVGVVLVAAASALPTVGRTLAEAVPAAAFCGMGLALLRNPGGVRG